CVPGRARGSAREAVRATAGCGSDCRETAGVRLERDLTVGIDARAGTRSHSQASVLTPGAKGVCPEVAGIRLERDLTEGIDARAGARHHPQLSIANTGAGQCPEMAGVRLKRNLSTIWQREGAGGHGTREADSSTREGDSGCRG